MLILTRNPGESIFIFDRMIQVVYISRNMNQIKLGIAAPKGVSIHREEVIERIELQKMQQGTIYDSTNK